MRKVGILEAKTHLSLLVEAVARGGEEIVITRHGKPLARLSAANDAQRSASRLSGAELLDLSRALRRQISDAAPETDQLTWDELKDEMRR